MILEVISAIVILGIALLFLNSSSLSMPMSVQSTLILALLLAFIRFAAFIFKEKSSDEREDVHVQKAGRISYLVGVGVLVVGLIYQALNHEIDSWLVFALCAMVFSKIIFRIYSNFKM